MIKKIVISLIEVYQTYLSFDRGLLATLSPGGACKYDISCSEYTKQAILESGVFKGIYLGLKRIWSCR